MEWFMEQDTYKIMVSEVVLAMLFSNFTFAPSDKTIYWNMAGIQYPTVDMNTRPEMPMKVVFVKPS